MNEDGALFDSGFDDSGRFRVTPVSGGVSLESALRDFGPAAIDDLIPRVRAIAAALDAAHAAGVVHGALHPSKVIVTDEATEVVAGIATNPPYIAPEVAAGGAATPASDQFALAAITYEWLFGRPIDRPADRPIEVRTMPGVDRVALSKVFTRALAPEPGHRFASCTEFCSGIANAVVPELPFDSGRDDASLNPDDLEIVAGESILTAAQPDLDVIAPVVAAPPRTMEPQRFGGGALILATLVGAVFGFAAGYMARPRALQAGPPQEIATAAQGTEAPLQAGEAGRAGKAGGDQTSPLPAPPASPAQLASGRLLVRSTPSGASVSVDGVAKGVTPLALRDLATGTLSITVARRGFLPETRRIAITAARPARTLDVRLSASASAAEGRSGETSPKLARSRASEGGEATGGMAIESRPVGASVTVNGRPSGKTPLTINDLAPGEYRILMTMPGYRNFATTVRVVAGERVRAAASLTAQEQE